MVSLLLLQSSVTAVGGVACASASERMGSASLMNHGSTAMPGTPRPVSEFIVLVPADQLCADAHGASCIAMGSCTSTGSLPSARSMDSPRPPPGATVALQPSAIPQSPSPTPDVPPPRA